MWFVADRILEISICATGKVLSPIYYKRQISWTHQTAATFWFLVDLVHLSLGAEPVSQQFENSCCFPNAAICYVQQIMTSRQALEYQIHHPIRQSRFVLSRFGTLRIVSNGLQVYYLVLGLLKTEPMLYKQHVPVVLLSYNVPYG